MKKGVIIIGLGNHVQNKIIPALNNLKIPIIGIITNNHEFKTDCKKYKNIKDLLLNNLDFKIILAHEPKNHIKLINDLPVSKSSILVEKPLLTNIQDIENYRNIFHKHEITEAMMYRFGKSFDEIKSFFDKNKKSIT